MAKRDLYDVLGVSRNASADEIKKAHRKAVRQFHPDRNKNNPQAEEKFREAQEAYDSLADPQKRQNYDQFGHAGVGVGGAGPGEGFRDPFEQFRRSQRGAPRGNRQWQAGPNVSVEDFDFRAPLPPSSSRFFFMLLGASTMIFPCFSSSSCCLM